MAGGRSVFKGAVGWDDWLWWVVIGSVALLILLLLVCCCVCMQRAKRKGREEALAAVQIHQRTTQQRDQQQQQQQERYQQPREIPLVNDNGPANGYQPPTYGYSTQVTAVPLAPNRKNVGPQVAANGYQENPPQVHTQQFAKPYPPLPGQHEGQATGQAPGQGDGYQVPSKWYNANAPSSYANSHYPDSLRGDAPYPDGEGVPFMSVTSPLASKGVKDNRKSDVRLQNHAMSNTNHGQDPPPVVVPKYTRIPPSPSETSGHSGSRASGNTLQSRIDALRLADSNDTVHSRISVESDDSFLTSQRELTDTDISDTMLTHGSYASGRTRRTALLMGSILSPKPSAIMSPPASFRSDRSYDTFDRDVFDSTRSTELGAFLTHGSSRSIDSDYAYGHYEDTESFGQRQTNTSSNEFAAGLDKPSRKDNVSAKSHGSVEF